LRLGFILTTIVSRKRPSSHHWLDNTIKAAAKFGRAMNIVPEFGRLLKEAGFEAVVDTTLKV
jgi:hypothetical protein